MQPFNFQHFNFYPQNYEFWIIIWYFLAINHIFSWEYTQNHRSSNSTCSGKRTGSNRVTNQKLLPKSWDTLHYFVFHYLLERKQNPLLFITPSHKDIFSFHFFFGQTRYIFYLNISHTFNFQQWSFCQTIRSPSHSQKEQSIFHINSRGILPNNSHVKTGKIEKKSSEGIFEEP